jgi:signal transduction histidine kinase
VRRPAITWTLFAAGLLVVLGGLAWVTLAALDLDRAEVAARHRADSEESVRLALWRMDSSVGPLIAAESVRPHYVYSSFYPASRAFTRLYQEIRPGDVQIASPLLTLRADHVHLHFQVDSDGGLSSPQVPVSNMLDMAESAYVDPEEIARLTAKREQLARLLADADLPSRLPPPQQRLEAPPVAQLVQGPQQAEQFKGRGGQESQARKQLAYLANAQAGPPVAQDVRTGILRAVRIGEEMLLARRVGIGSQEIVQGLWLDGPALRGWLLELVDDLLPDASLGLVETENGDSDTRRLASLPLRLEPGTVPVGDDRGMTPIRVALLIAWIAALLGCVGVAALLRGALVLGERRAAFVSAVTHELRTPLTTFRMYTELLASDMIEEEKRAKYLDTLQRESDRLGHLVENVLAYAGLERGRNGGETESLDLGEALERLRPTLTEAAERAGMRLEIESGEEPIFVRGDRSAIERIVRNLVDNACKYAAGAEDPRIEVRCESSDGEVSLKVADHGPGIPSAEAARIFRPFRKSAKEAAHSAPGVGLGLALSRALARAMGGDLRLVENSPPGATFQFQVPAARPESRHPQ